HSLVARTNSDGLIRAVDAHDDSTLPVTSAGSALAVLTPGLAPSQLQAVRDLVDHGAPASPCGVRSLHRDHPELAPRNYWRGPVWTNVTWLCAMALGERGEQAIAAE